MGEDRPARHRPPEADSGEAGGGEGTDDGEANFDYVKARQLSI